MVFLMPTFFTGPPALNEEKKRIAENLRRNITQAGPATSLYLDLATDTRSRKYLKASSYYNVKKKSWTTINQNGGSLENIRGIFTHIFNQTINALGQRGDLRVAIDNYGTHFKHFNSKTLESSPSIVIKAEGPSFETPEGAGIGWSNIASIIELQLNAFGLSIEDQVYEVGLKVQQIFAHQPNRRSVNGLFLTETKATFFRFDCAGVCYTEPINYYDYPKALIRMILGLSAQDENLLGFDTSIRWIHDSTGKKVEGTMEVRRFRGGCEYTTIYRHIELVNREQETKIVGRGTTCWIVEDPEARISLFVKDQFRDEGNEAEGDFLNRASGIDGVVQPVASEPSRTKVSIMRALGTGVKAQAQGLKKDKVQSRLVMKKCGNCIKEFDTEKQLLEALRDVILAHCKLVCDRKILHRDISFNNILLGLKGAMKGYRGHLIDFDMAIPMEKLTERSGACGTLIFQSVNVLRSWQGQKHIKNVALHHDHHDDLQSIFYVLLLIVTCMNRPHDKIDKSLFSKASDADEPLAPGPAMLKVFNGDDREAAADFKAKLFAQDSLDAQLVGVSDFWSESTKTLLKEFFKALTFDVRWKESLRWEPGCREVQKEVQKAKVDNAEVLYNKILASFDKALANLEVEEKTKARDSAAAPNAPLTEAAVNLPAILLGPEVPLERKRKALEERRDDRDSIFGSLKGDEHASKENANENFEHPERQIKRMRRAVPAPPSSPRKTKACTQEK